MSRSPQSPSEQGYVMILALVTLVVLSLGLSVAAEQVQSTRLLAGEIDKRSRSRLALISAQSRMTYALIKSEDNNVSQQDALFADPGSRSRLLQQAKPDRSQLIEQFNTEYLLDQDLLAAPINLGEGTTATVVRENGLIDINARDDAYTRYIADKLGGKNSRRLVAALRDFTDEDRMVRSGGAEQSEYGASLKIPNAPLRHRDELCQIRGWSAIPVCQNVRDRALSLTAGAGGVVIVENSTEALQTQLVGRLEADRNPAGVWMTAAQRERFVDFVLAGNGGNGKFRMVLDFADQPDIVGIATIRIMPNVSSVPFEIEETDIVSIRG